MTENTSHSPLPSAWRDALERDAAGAALSFADPLPERRAARLLAAFLAAGLVFMALPGTLLGVWNLVGISSRHEAGAIPAAWLQAHGHAQLFGWVATFIIGISLYTFPKFRASQMRSLPLGWALLALWIPALAARWWAGVQQNAWTGLMLTSAALELMVGLLLIWQLTGKTRDSHNPGQAWEILIFGGFAGLILTLLWQLAAAWSATSPSVLDAGRNHILVSLALWVFCLPVVLGYSARFLPALAGLRETNRPLAIVSLSATAIAAILLITGALVAAQVVCLISAAAGCAALGVFRPAAGTPKTRGVYARYPLFARSSFAWLFLAATLGLASHIPGMLGASRHAFTVGFLSVLIFSLGPRILPSFVNSRELHSPALMRISLYLLTLGCALRVLFEPLAYSDAWGFAWRMLPISAFVELSAVLVFALNMGWTLATPYPVWMDPNKHIHARLALYWLITSYPETRPLLVQHGLHTLRDAPTVPKSLMLQDAVAADNADMPAVLQALRNYLQTRLAKTLRSPQSPPAIKPH